MNVLQSQLTQLTNTHYLLCGQKRKEYRSSEQLTIPQNMGNCMYFTFIIIT